MKAHENRPTLRNGAKISSFFIIFAILFLVESTCPSASTCYGKEKAERTVERCTVTEARSVADDPGQALSRFNEIISVAILIAAAIFTVYFLRASNKKRNRQKKRAGSKTARN